MARHKEMTTHHADQRSRFVVAFINKAIGLGNRLLALFSCFLVALLTQRTLLVYWPQTISPLGDLFILPPELNWNFVQEIEKFDLDQAFSQSDSLEFLFFQSPI